MRAEFSRPEAPEDVVAIAAWDADTVRFDTGEPELEAALGRVFRATPVVVDDPALRSAGTSGPSTLEPGGLAWFVEAALTRAGPEGLLVRLVSTEPGMGWDPAGAYRTFRQSVDRVAGAPAAPQV